MNEFGLLVRASGLTLGQIASAHGCRTDSVRHWTGGRRVPPDPVIRYVREVAGLVDSMASDGVSALMRSGQFFIGDIIEPSVSEMIAARVLARFLSSVTVERTGNQIIMVVA